MSGRLFLSLIIVVASAIVCALIVMKGLTGVWDWIGLMAFGGMAVRYGFAAYKDRAGQNT